MVLRKKDTYSIITPIPANVPRQLALDLLHSHGEVIKVNPLVLDYKSIKPPANAPADEYYSQWYEITERIQIMPGMGKLGSSKITFNGCFHNLSWGLQTHVNAPGGVDLRIKYRIAGNQPGVEPAEQQEMGLAALGAPKDGLYLREDVEVRCNFTLVGVVKSGLQKASKDMVDRIIKKAELLDAGVLQGMIEDGQLKTMHPSEAALNQALPTPSAPFSPRFSPPQSPISAYSGSGPPSSPGLSVGVPYQVPRPVSLQPPPGHHQYRPPSSTGSAHTHAPYEPPKPPTQTQFIAELPSSEIVNHSIAMELPGDMSYQHSPAAPQRSPSQHPLPSQSPPPNQQYHQNPAAPQRSPSLHPPPSQSPPPSQQYFPQQGQPQQQPGGGDDWRWSQSQQSQPSPYRGSYAGSATSEGGYTSSSATAPSPYPDQKSFSSELPTHRETREEYGRPPVPGVQRQQSYHYQGELR